MNFNLKLLQRTTKLLVESLKIGQDVAQHTTNSGVSEEILNEMFAAIGEVRGLLYQFHATPIRVAVDNQKNELKKKENIETESFLTVRPVTSADTYKCGLCFEIARSRGGGLEHLRRCDKHVIKAVADPHRCVCGGKSTANQALPFAKKYSLQNLPPHQVLLQAIDENKIAVMCSKCTACVFVLDYHIEKDSKNENVLNTDNNRKVLKTGRKKNKNKPLAKKAKSQNVNRSMLNDVTTSKSEETITNELNVHNTTESTSEVSSGVVDMRPMQHDELHTASTTSSAVGTPVACVASEMSALSLDEADDNDINDDDDNNDQLAMTDLFGEDIADDNNTLVSRVKYNNPFAIPEDDLLDLCFRSEELTRKIYSFSSKDSQSNSLPSSVLNFDDDIDFPFNNDQLNSSPTMSRRSSIGSFAFETTPKLKRTFDETEFPPFQASEKILRSNDATDVKGDLASTYLFSSSMTREEINRARAGVWYLVNGDDDSSSLQYMQSRVPDRNSLFGVVLMPWLERVGQVTHFNAQQHELGRTHGIATDFGKVELYVMAPQRFAGRAAAFVDALRDPRNPLRLCAGRSDQWCVAREPSDDDIPLDTQHVTPLAAVPYESRARGVLPLTSGHEQRGRHSVLPELAKWHTRIQHQPHPTVRDNTPADASIGFIVLVYWHGPCQLHVPTSCDATTKAELQLTLVEQSTRRLSPAQMPAALFSAMLTNNRRLLTVLQRNTMFNAEAQMLALSALRAHAKVETRKNVSNQVRKLKTELVVSQRTSAMQQQQMQRQLHDACAELDGARQRLANVEKQRFVEMMADQKDKQQMRQENGNEEQNEEESDNKEEDEEEDEEEEGEEEQEKEQGKKGEEKERDALPTNIHSYEDALRRGDLSSAFSLSLAAAVAARKESKIY